MKRRPSSSFLVCVAVAVVLGGIGFWFLSKLKAFPMQQWGSLTFSEILRGETGYTPEQKAAARKRLTELDRELLAEFPALVIPENSVPYDQNGFRLLYDLSDGSAKDLDLNMPVTPKLQDLLKSSSPWDPVAMRAALEANVELIAKIERIAALPRRSSANMPPGYDGYIRALEIKACGDILMAKARLAAEAKDEAEALRLTTATLNLASHLDQVEAPTFLHALVAILIDLSVNETVINHLLPVLGRDADLPRWQAALTSRPNYTADHYASLIRGEWHIAVNHLFVPMLLAPGTDDNPRDAEAFSHAFAERYDFLIRNLKGQKPSVLVAMPKPPAPKIKLSDESRKLLEVNSEGFTSWTKGYARAGSVRAINLAALDLLILEKSGITLTADSVSAVTLEPLTGQAFLYDPATRTLTIPSAISGDVDVKPVTLPW